MKKVKRLSGKVYVFLLVVSMIFSVTSLVLAADAQNLIKNGDFSNSLSNAQPDGNGVLDSEGSWSLFLNNGEANADAYIESDFLNVQVKDNGPNDYSVQLLQSPLKVTRGSKYLITFDARADGDRSIVVKVGATASRGWTGYVQETKQLSKEWKSYQVEMTMLQDTDEKARFEFWFLNDGSYYIDDIKMKKIGEIELREEGNLTEEDENKVEDWKLVWEDNFDTINPDNWTFELGSPDWNGDGEPDRWGNNELQYYQKDNASIKDGKLVITAREEKVEDLNTTFDYTSSRMVTKDKYEVKYGRMEIRAKLPIGQGIWPAIWMLGNDIDSNPWPACGEIDIMEYLGNEPSTVHGTIHGPVSGGAGIGAPYILEEGTFNDDFHVFAMEWDEDEMELYVDDVLYHVVNKYEIGEEDWVFDHPFFFILNLAVGGNWPGYPDDTTVFPQTMEVDYVRVYEDTDPDSITGKEVWDSEYEERLAEGEDVVEYTEAEIVNGDFSREILNNQEESPDNWYVWTGEGGSASGSVVDGEFRMDVSSVGNQSWAIQLAQFVKLPAGNYRLSFKARADDERDLNALVQHDGGSWTVYGQDTVNLTSSMQEFTVDVKLDAGDTPKLSFNFGNTPASAATTVYIDDVKIEAVD